MAYEGLKDYEYIDASRHSLGAKGVLEVFEDLIEDNLVMQINVSYNIQPEEFHSRHHIEAFLKQLKRHLLKTKKLIAIDTAGNALFHYFPHPANEHIKNYVIEMTELIAATKITHIDLSDNNIIGLAGRELKGLIYFSKKLCSHLHALSLRSSLLNSQGLLALQHLLGIHSTLEYLDISDNFGGLDPLGNKSSEGIKALTAQMSKSLNFRVLKIARNRLQDEDVELITAAIQQMPQFQDLVLDGNLCRRYSCRDLKTAIMSHAAETEPNWGFRELNMSRNPFGDDGAKELSVAVHATYTLKTLRLAHCHISDIGASFLYEALKENSGILTFDIFGNKMSQENDTLLVAEVEANNLLHKIREDPMAIDCSQLSPQVYSALARKLRYLESEHLKLLHSNPSFNVHKSEMKDSLHILEPPPRKVLIAEVKAVDKSLVARLEKSRVIARQVAAAHVIASRVMRWYKNLKKRKDLMAALMEAKRREKEQNRWRFDDDDDDDGEDADEGDEDNDD